MRWHSKPLVNVPRWRFFLQELASGHWVSVARGPPDNIVDAWQEFTGTLEQPVIPAPKFQVLHRSRDLHHCSALAAHPCMGAMCFCRRLRAPVIGARELIDKGMSPLATGRHAGCAGSSGGAKPSLCGPAHC